MLMPRPDGTYTTGPLDVLLILHNVGEGTYHAAFYEERPMPGPIQDIADLRVVRLFSKMHHTEGADSFEGALEHLHALAEQLNVPEANICDDAVVDWDGTIGDVLVTENWVRAGRSFAPAEAVPWG